MAAAAFAGLLLIAFGPTLAELAEIWIEWPEYGHGLLMPPVAAWMIWERRHKLARLRRTETWGGAWAALGAAIMLLPLMAALLAGEMKLSWFLKAYAFAPCVAAGVLILYGWQGLKALAAPIAVLMLMCPLPYRVHTALTLPLKHYAAVLATGLLDLSGLKAGLEGSIIHIPGVEALGVVDACSGIRSLLSLTAVAILGCLVWNRRWPIKAVVIASCLPLAVVVNAVRIWLTGLLSVYVSPELAQGFYHVFEGYLLFGAASLALLAWALILNKVFPAANNGRKAHSQRAEAASTVGGRRARSVAIALSLTILAAGSWTVYQVRGRFQSDVSDPVAAARLESSLKNIPLKLDGGNYRGDHVVWSDDVVAHSGVDAYGAYDYTDRSGRNYQVFLGGAIRGDENLHTPNVCMPASGWEALESQSVASALGPTAMSRLLVQNGRRQMIVYYWFQSGDRLASDAWTVRVRRLLDVLHNRPLSPSLVVSVYVPISGSVEATESAARRFLREIGPSLRKATDPGDIHG